MNAAPPPGSLRPEPPIEPPPAELSRASSVLGRIANILLGKVATLVLATLAFAISLATFICPHTRHTIWRATRRRRRPGSGEHLRSAAARRNFGRAPDARLGRAPPWVRRVATARAARAAVRRGRGGAGHRGGVFCRGVLPLWHPGLVQRPGPSGGHRITAGLARLSRGAPRQYPLGGSGDGQRPHACRPVPHCRSIGVRRGAGYADNAARPDRGGDLRSSHQADACRRRVVRRHGCRAAIPGRHRRRRKAATLWCWRPATARVYRRS